MIIDKNLKFKPGQLLVEVLIGIGIMAILVAAIIPLLITSSMGLAKEQKDETGTFLAREQIDAAKTLKEQDWNNIYFPLNTPNKGIGNLYHLLTNAGSWQLATGAESVTLNGTSFQRYLIIDNVSRTGSNGTGNIEATYTAARDDPSTQRIRSVVTGTGGAPITITEYFSRWSNSFWTQTDWSGGVSPNWQNPPGNTYASTNNIDPLTTAGTLMLTKTGSGTGNYGNRSLLTATGTIGRLNNSTYRDDMRFTAQKSGQATQVRVYLASANNSGTMFYRYGIQADNSGQPSGVYLASQTAAFSSTGWQTVNLAAAVNLTAGTVYHLVVQYNSGTTPNGSHYIDIRNSAPENNLVPKNQAADLNQNTLFYNGSWTIRNQEPIYVLGFNDGSFEGNPYDSSAARSIYGGNYEGEKFTTSNVDTTISNLSLYLAKNANQNPAAALRVILRDLTTNSNLIDNSSITGAALTTTFSWQTINIVPNIVLTNGHQYRLYLSSQGSASNRYYKIYCESNPDTADYNNINWDGTNSVTSRSIDSGNTWTESNFIDMAGYNFTTVTLQSYASFGELISSSYNTGKRAGFNRISWTFPASPAGTTIKMQLAANTDNATWNFLGPDGTNASYYTIAAGENIYYQLSGNQYLRYKVRLETTNPQVTPTLNDISLNFSL